MSRSRSSYESAASRRGSGQPRGDPSRLRRRPPPASDSFPAMTEHPAKADALVVFGITGDLANKQTFQALYRLTCHGRLECPVVGVAADNWTADHLRDHARESITATGE